MFNQFAQRLVPSFGRSAAMHQGCRGAFSMLGRKSMMSTSASVFGKRLPEKSIQVNSLSSIFSRSLVINSRSVAVPSSLTPSSPCTVVGSTLALQTRGFASKKHRAVIRQSKGFRGRANNCFRIAIRRLEKSWQYAYRDRKVKKREFRKLWIQRLNAGARQQGISYSKFIAMQNKSGVTLDRKILSGLAMYEPFSFKAVVDVVKMSAANGAGN